MTLADWIRKYLEDRRKACEQKAQYLDLPSNNVQFYTDHNEDDNVITLSNDQFFSNDIEPKLKDKSHGSKSKTYQKSVGVSRSSRIRTLPDGTIEVETIIRDSNGKEEKHVTYQKDGKKYTTIFRKSPTGEEEVEEKVGAGAEIEIFPVNPLNPERFSRSRHSSDSDSGYDYWYDRFFNSRESKSKERSNDVKAFDPNKSMDEQMEQILRRFGIDGFFGSVPGIPTNRNVEDDPNVNDGTFTEFNDSAVHEELRKMFESFGMKDFNPDINQQKKGNNRHLERQMDNIFKNVTPPKPLTLFEQFSEDAYIELPEDNTPLDKFIDPDEERLSKLRPKLQKSKDMLKKLEEYFAGKPSDSLERDFYSDIEDPKDIDLPLLLPQPQPEFPPNLNNFGDILRKTLDPNTLFKSGNIQTQMYFGDGKRRIESIGKDKDGNTEKNILYEIGDQQYNVKIVTNRFGVQVKREKSHNFPDRELPQFKKQWGKAFVSDLMDD